MFAFFVGFGVVGTQKAHQGVHHCTFEVFYNEECYVHNIFIINLKWYVIIGYNFKSTIEITFSAINIR